MEQIAILDVLFLYVENATFLQDIQSDQINDLREIARIEKNKSPKVSCYTWGLWSVKRIEYEWAHFIKWPIDKIYFRISFCQ